MGSRCVSSGGKAAYPCDYTSLMKVSIRQKLERSAERCEEVGRMLADPQVHERADQFRELSMEYARLLPTANALQEYRQLEAELESAEALSADGDAAMRALGEEE